jgi:hypothetical protein
MEVMVAVRSDTLLRALRVFLSFYIKVGLKMEGGDHAKAKGSWWHMDVRVCTTYASYSSYFPMQIGPSLGLSLPSKSSETAISLAELGVF